jgi:regulator of protease activity HflC (stomatin/prohibitin superfamily)
MPNRGLAVVRQYERGVVFRPGRLRGVREPGLHATIPLVDRMRKVSLRTVTMPIPSQQVITRDNVSIGVAAVAYFRRSLQVLAEIAIEHNSTIVFPARLMDTAQAVGAFVRSEADGARAAAPGLPAMPAAA